MKRQRYSIPAGVLFLSAVVACSENPNELQRIRDARSSIVTTTLTLDESINLLLALFPADLGSRNEQRVQQGQNEDLNPRAEWVGIKAKYAAGLSKPAQMIAAKKQLFRLSDWVTRNAQEMNAPPNDETKTAAASRLVLYMSLYVYAGPERPTPSYVPSADAVVGIVTPNAPATIVTPTTHAGVQFEAGSVGENTVIVITQSPTQLPDNCSGPLQTKYCQYPQFYTFDQFPEKGLLKPAKINVCHVNSGENRRPLVDHNRLRLAHTKPANPADYTPGSTIRDGNGENIEILPLVTQTFSSCAGSVYATGSVGGGPIGFLSRVATGLQRIFTPKTAYAIDGGLGGIVKRFSPFNTLDTLGAPDLKVQSVSFAPLSAHPGDHVGITYTISNIGKATNTLTPAAVLLSTDAALTPADVSVAPIPLPILPPESTITLTQTVVIPDTTAVGSYYLGLAIQNDPAFPDANLLNNQASVPLTIAPSFISMSRTMAVGSYTACALAPNTNTYCWGGNERNQFGTATRFLQPTLTPFAPQIPIFATLSGGNAQHTCGIMTGGSAMCWGRADFGALGNGTVFGNVAGSVPVTVAGGISWTTINVSRLSSCGVSNTGVGYCWGTNQRGELGTASIPPTVQPPEGGLPTANTPTPHILDGGHLWKSVVAGWLHACGITTTGVAYCWGDNAAGQLGIGTADNDLTHLSPAPVATTERFIQLSLGTRSTCGITVNHEAFCWGENGTGQIGDGTTTFRTVPTPVAGGRKFSYIAVSTGFPEGTTATPPGPIGAQGNIGHTCALTENGAPYCWGWNPNGQVGDGTTVDRLTPQAVVGGFSFTSIGLGGSTSCGRRGNQIWCWGSSLLGQLGNGTQVDALTPTLVSSPFNVP